MASGLLVFFSCSSFGLFTAFVVASIVLWRVLFFFCSFSIRFLEQREKIQPEVITTFHNIKSFNELLPLSLFQQHERVILAHINVSIVWIVNTISNSIVLRFTYGLCYIITILHCNTDRITFSYRRHNDESIVSQVNCYDSFRRRMFEVKKKRKLF